ncbi:LLM class flavin-dependent oxidoreductase [Amycolatopsis sp. NPDC059657]|uniref:LLM class flavin-dependent oxidoreductase n=1 Tax=Amycolatopsis sp. NPDC059657 TaxID=3346899 RepID=UPI0036707C06
MGMIESMTTKPFRFGVVASSVPDLASFTDLARQAESLGYDTLLAPDPFNGLDPFTALSAAAAVTTTLRLGTFVAVGAFRDKKQLDWQTHSLHTLTGGRFQLGLGTGRPGADQVAAGLGREFGSGGDRLRELEETLAYLKKREDRAPILLTGGGPKILDLAAREADIVSFAWYPQPTEAAARPLVDTFRERAGDRDVELAGNLLMVGDEPKPWLKQIFGADFGELKGSVSAVPLDAADILRRRRETLGFSYWTLNMADMVDFAPVVAELRGT